MSEIPPCDITTNIDPTDELRKQPSDSFAKEVINPDVNNKIDTKSEDSPSLLFLTNYRLIQQKQSDKVKQIIAYKKMLLFGKRFQIRHEKPKFCGRYKSARLKINKT